jgi:hypothetical protein
MPAVTLVFPVSTDSRVDSYGVIWTDDGVAQPPVIIPASAAVGGQITTTYPGTFSPGDTIGATYYAIDTPDGKQSTSVAPIPPSVVIPTVPPPPPPITPPGVGTLAYAP